MSGRRAPPRLSPEDAALWRRVTESVRPIRAIDPHRDTGQENAPTETGQAPQAPPSEPRGARTEAPKRLPHSPGGVVDKRLVRRIGRGKAAVDGVLDLHGLTQRQAFPRLLAFLRDSQTAGRRLVLVVTGKGRFDEAGDWWQEGARGVLRRAVPEWLATPEFRPLVVGFRQAHDRKGGEGALYVQIRRKRSGSEPA